MSSQETKNCLIDAMVHDDQVVLGAIERLGNCSVCFCGVIAENKLGSQQVGACADGLSSKAYQPEVDRNWWLTRQQRLHRS